MRGKARIAAIGVMCTAFLLTGVLLPVAASADPAVDVLLDELNSPKGLALLLDGDLLVGQGAFGPPDPVLEYVLHGRDKGEVNELTPPENVMDIATGADGSIWAIGGDLQLYRRDPATGVVSSVFDVEAYQTEDPDPYDVEDNPTETNPYGLIVLPSGDALFADAASNDLVRVEPDGDATTVARFDVEETSTDHLPPEAGFPPTIPAESVPTSVTLGPDGDVLVGELKGFPFRPGTAKVWRVDPDEEDAVCSVNTPDDDCTVFDDGFTAINDIAWHGPTSTLYVYELAEDGTLAFEAGFETGEFPPAVLLEVKGDSRKELAEGQLSQPGGIVIKNRGLIYVTDGMFSEGRLVRVRR
jgi:hypothetical protein